MVTSRVQFPSEKPKKNKIAFVGILLQITLWSASDFACVLFTSEPVKVVDIYRAASRFGKNG